ncbi:MAG: putative glycosyltransferase [Urechidicola sp.]
MVFIYVQHLLGIGHLRRISFIAAAMANHQFEVHLVSGGMPVSDLNLMNVQLHQLPPVRATNGLFNELVDYINKPIDQPWKDRRCEALLNLFDSIEPDVLITETFPFGRRMMRFELLPLLQQAKKKSNPPLILSSIRDILQPKQKQHRNIEILDLIKQYYDKVLVHGDDSIATLETTFPHAKKIALKVSYTGYIVNPNTLVDTKACTKSEGVLVSGGGGAASLPLLKAAIGARPLSNLKDHTWRLLVGHNIDQTTFENLQQHADSGLIIERNRSDFYSLLKSCKVSISQAGYNTVMDILKAKARSVIVPYAESGELEQTIRANLLHKQNRVTCINPAMLNAKTLAEAVDAAAIKPIIEKQYRMNGANKSAELIKGWLN